MALLDLKGEYRPLALPNFCDREMPSMREQWQWHLSYGITVVCYSSNGHISKRSHWSAWILGDQTRDSGHMVVVTQCTVEALTKTPQGMIHHFIRSSKHEILINSLDKLYQTRLIYAACSACGLATPITEIARWPYRTLTRWSSATKRNFPQAGVHLYSITGLW
ncbi:hypothetical protein NPIL_635761 [Nephila pilipes]|uniref:Uncharacterized protein n=1 Tax=Nephila pilipes TaxID=299642 RepID=A0A8X6IR10_NEPPI|nr:hypothetical protein NPIL_635761 [Nephila pilipes]